MWPIPFSRGICFGQIWYDWFNACTRSIAGREGLCQYNFTWMDKYGYEYVPSQEDHAFQAAGRVGCPADIANMVVFLADNEKSGFVTCQEFVIDGGCSKRMYYPD